MDAIAAETAVTSLFYRKRSYTNMLCLLHQSCLAVPVVEQFLQSQSQR